ncbi:MAG: SRPBCC family protein [Flavobacteriaceae bacterium]
MTTITKQITINASQQKIWKIVSDLGGVYKFNPGVRKSYYTTDKTNGVGAARICELQPVGRILETVKNWKEGESFLLQISPIEKAVPLKNFSGLFELNELNNNSIQVSVTINYDMKLGTIGILLNNLIMKSKMGNEIEDLLKGLKVHSETGIEIKDTKTLRKILGAA